MDLENVVKKNQETLYGVVGLQGYNISINKDRSYKLNSNFIVWKRPGGTLQYDILPIQKETNTKEMDKFQIFFNPMKKIAIEGKIIQQDDGTGKLSKYCKLIKIIKMDIDDLELDRVVEEIKHNQTFEHERFGKFTFNDLFMVYEGQNMLFGQKVDIWLKTENMAECKKCLEILQQISENSAQWKADLIDVLVHSMFQARNDWAFDCEEYSQYTEEQFIESLDLKRLIIHTNGSLIFNYFDAVFEDTGHGMVVRGNINSGLTGGYLEG